MEGARVVATRAPAPRVPATETRALTTGAVVTADIVRVMRVVECSAPLAARASSRVVARAITLFLSLPRDGPISARDRGCAIAVNPDPQAISIRVRRARTEYGNEEKTFFISHSSLFRTKRHFLAAPTRALPTPPRMKPPDPASVGAYPGANDASSRDYSKWDDAISVERVRQLRDEGWCVVDDFSGGGGASSSSSDATSRGADGADVASGERWATAIRDEIKWLSGTGLMRPNRTHFANPKVRAPSWAPPSPREICH